MSLNLNIKNSSVHEKDKVIENAISKLVEIKIHQLEKEILELKNELKKFEKKYRLSSEQFSNKFQSGKLGDNLDFTDWIAIYKMINNRINDKSLLIGNR